MVGKAALRISIICNNISLQAYPWLRMEHPVTHLLERRGSGDEIYIGNQHHPNA